MDELEEFPFLGFHLGGASRITDSPGIAVDFGWNRRSESEGEVKLTSFSYTTFSAGPRFYFGNRVTGFVHALFGVIRTNGDVELSESFLEAVQVVLPPESQTSKMRWT